MFAIGFSAIEVAKPQLWDNLYQTQAMAPLRLLHGIGIWYIWLVFMLAFGLSAVAKHIPFYNIPAFVLYLSAAILWEIVCWRRKVAA